jgi:hypothetical protein
MQIDRANRPNHRSKSMILNRILFFASLAVCLAANAQQEGVPLIAARDYLSSAEEQSQVADALSKMRSRTDRISNVRVARFNPHAVLANIVTVVLPDGTERQYVATKIERLDFEADRLATVAANPPKAPDMAASASVTAEVDATPKKPAYVQAAPVRSWIGKSKTGTLNFAVGEDGGFHGVISDLTNRRNHYRLSRLPGGLIAVQTVVNGMVEATADEQAAGERERFERTGRLPNQ